MPQANTRWTADMVRALPDDGNRYEVIDGVLFVTPAPNVRHQRAVAELQVPLTLYTRSTGIGETLASPADISAREDRLVQPDIFVFASAAGRRVRDWAEITHLLLAVEVLSPSTARADRQEKRRVYAELADEYWIVDLDARLIERWRPGETRPEIVTDRLVWQTPAPNPFELDLPEYFASVDGD
ncbi:MAG: Uma2 family endonuclease [Gemmatimonadetes bacterium]|nr:Uma2 family endonuclease [Gemmatimonadota bacterium]